MNETTGQGSFKLEVTDFGPIIEAEVDLRPLTVFVGPSNTGKSYLAILIYALHQVFSHDAYSVGRRFRRGFRFQPGHDGQNLPEESIDALLEAASSFADESERPGQDEIVLPSPIVEAIRSGFNKQAETLSREIRRCFGVGDTRVLNRKGTKKSRIVMRQRIRDQSELLKHTILLASNPEFDTSVPAKVQILDDFKTGDRMFRFLHQLKYYVAEGKSEKRRLNYAVLEALASLSDMILPSLVGPLRLPAYYLPADRTGIMHSHSVVVSALIANAPSAGLRPVTRTPMLSGVLADFLEQLIDIGQTRYRRRKARPDLSENIENSILSGSVRIDESTLIEYPRFSYRPRGWKEDLALANASSMVSELAPVVLYLRHLIKPGNILILEEPESHLHPAMQVELTRQLAALVRAGVRVIVTTHSEWLLEELANIVRRSEIPERKRGDGIALRPDQVGAWLFQQKQRPKGSIIKEIRLDDAGFYPSGYDEVANALHNEWADITSRIEADS